MGLRWRGWSSHSLPILLTNKSCGCSKCLTWRDCVGLGGLGKLKWLWGLAVVGSAPTTACLIQRCWWSFLISWSQSPPQCCNSIYLLSLFPSLLLFWTCWLYASPLLRPCCTRLSTSSRPCSIHFTTARVNQHLPSSIPFTRKLWNSLPDFVFPPTYDLNSFERGVSRPLHD